MKNIFLVFLFLFSLGTSYSQELNMDVNVKVQETKIVEERVFKTLERSISEFYNNTQWTEDEFEDEEKIECNFQVTIKEEVSATSFTADFVIQVIRPVYGGNYSTQIFNYVDKAVSFTYQELQPIQDNTELYTDNLSSILTFYAYIILGMDYDTFSSSGGDPYFTIARNIVSNVPTSNNDKGWEFKGGNSRSRNKLISHILNPSATEYREAIYEYHRLGLDALTQDLVKSKLVIGAALEKIKNVERALPNSMIVKNFADSKFEELVELYKPSSTPEKKKIYNILVKLDPAQTDELQAIKP